MENFDQFFWIFFLAIAAIFLYRFLRYGGLAGGLLGVRLGEASGEVELDPAGGMKTRIRVHRVDSEPDREPKVALVFTSRSLLSASMTPFKMSVSQARELARLLERASQAR